uniref:Nuclear pore complex protein NUP35 n=1 Tax=Leersia perrieri TaxID=77586 RepID=A0A0D9WIS5_9ORYZ
MAAPSSRSPASSTRRGGGGGARLSPFFRDLASPIPTHRAASRFASSSATNPSATTPPPPPLFTLDDRMAAADFSPDATASELLPVASSPSPRAATSRSPSWDRSRGRVSAPGSPMDGVVEVPRKEVLALPPPSSPGTPAPPPPPPAAEARSPVTPATVAAGAEKEMNGGEVDREEWITVFGFSLGDTNLVIREFEKCGVILRHQVGTRDGNWIHILYLFSPGLESYTDNYIIVYSVLKHSYDARKALQKNGIQLSSGVIIGVKPIDAMHRQQLDERSTEIKQGGFMVSLPPKSLVSKGTGASNQLGAMPRPYDPKANTNGTRDVSRRATGSLAAPAKSLVTNVMDLIFGI